MITFKQFISESRSAPLYHGTTASYVHNILKHNVLEGRSLQSTSVLQGKRFDRFKSPLGDGKRGVSLSRSFNISKRFGNIIFELDQQKLQSKYIIRPLNYWNSMSAVVADTYKNEARSQKHQNDNEYEEFLLGDVKDLKKYITAIWVPESSVKYYESYGIPIKTYD